MKIKQVAIKNFRLLQDTSIGLEDRTTLIVGRNNSGKTSIAELFRRLLGDKPPSFKLEDFSLGRHEDFWTAFLAFREGQPPEVVCGHLPSISIVIDIAYDVAAADLGPLSECIIDLDTNCTFARLKYAFAPRIEATATLFGGIAPPESGSLADRSSVFRAIGARLTTSYVSTIEAIDPNDPTNTKSLDLKTLASVIRFNFINAQRGLDDDTHRERDVLGKAVEALFQSALTNPRDPLRRTTAEELRTAVEDIQVDLHTGFNQKLTSLLPAFSLFGYPGLADPGLVTETSFDVERLLNDHTKVRYKGANGVTLPETYNGLGVRNLVLILLQLLRFFREYQSIPDSGGVHLVFIEEPEAHLHPQMQEVFIRQLDHIVAAFVAQLNDNRPWPVQFVLTTHSPHMANECRFEAMRYFLSKSDNHGFRRSVVKDLRSGIGGTPKADREFLHQFLTLTRCDLFFADKAVLVEGTSERLLLPSMIKKIDAVDPSAPQLGSQYLTVLEVGGAYAHLFLTLLKFLELKTLIVTDIDSVKKNVNNRRETSLVADGEFTSNACIKAWFEADISPADLIAKPATEKTVQGLRLAYQIPEADGGPCGRSFEDAFVLANPALFNLGPGDLAKLAFDFAADQKKSTFALTYAIQTPNWNTPKYIAEGLRWLAETYPAPLPVGIGVQAAPAAPVLAMSIDGAGADA